MATYVEIVSRVEVSVRRFHIHIPWLLAVNKRRRISLDKIRHTNAGPMHDLAPALDALELGHQLMPRQPENVLHGQKQSRCALRERRTALPSLLFATRHSTATTLSLFLLFD